MTLTRRQWLRHIKRAGFGRLPAAIMSSVIMAESGGRTDARNYNPPTPRFPLGTIDRGGAQINDGWWPQYSDDDCDNPATAAAACWVISQSGTRFTDWAAYNNRAYRPFLPRWAWLMGA